MQRHEILGEVNALEMHVQEDLSLMYKHWVEGGTLHIAIHRSPFDRLAEYTKEQDNG